jgi:pimeloyl-ACP methyl ester carboxylesterase
MRIRGSLAARLAVAAALAAAATVALMVLASPAAAARMIQVPSNGPGPAAFDHVDVYKFGPKQAKRVLVLLPGTAAGAGDFILVAKDLVNRVKGLSVWALDRRSQPLEDTAMFEAALAGKASLQETYDYYLGWLTNGGTPAQHFNFLDTDSVPFAQRWGMASALEDARRVVKKARRGGRQVILGGHSLGASLAAAYAAWDFDGRPGYKALDAIMLIDGGLLGSFVDTYSKAEAQAQLDTLPETPFLDLLGTGIPESAGLFAELGGVFARLDPMGSAATLQDSPLLPAAFKPAVTVTNEALLAHSFDRDTSPQSLALLHVNAGRLAASGDPRPWEDGGITPAANIARTFGREPANGVEWYFPRRLTIDTDGADRMRQNAVAKLLDLRLQHTKAIDVPIYAFQTDLTDGDVLEGAASLVRKAATPKRDAMLVDGEGKFSHLDPLTAEPSKNRFAETAARFIKRSTKR